MDPLTLTLTLYGNEVRKYRQYMNRRGGFNRPLEEGGGSGF